MDFNKKNLRKLLIIIICSILFYELIQNISIVKNGFDKVIDVLFPFILGVVIAFIVNIPMRIFENKVFTKKNSKKKFSKSKRIVSMIISYLIIILILIFIVKLIIPELISIIVVFVQDIPRVSENIKQYAIDLTEQYPQLSDQIKNINFNWDGITKEIIAKGTSLITGIVSSSISVIMTIVGGIFNALIAIVFSIYILLSKEKLLEQFKKIITAYCSEKTREYIFHITSLSEKAFVNFITGQCTEAVILGTLCLIGTLILRIPYATTVSVLIGVTALIPIFGAIIGGAISAILILSISSTKAIIFLVFLIILQQIETNIIYPRVVGSSVGLPGMWVLVAVSVGGSLWGVVGFLVGVPLVSVIYTVLGDNVNSRLKKIEG